MQDLELATLSCVRWSRNKRLFGPIVHLPPMEPKARLYAMPRDRIIQSALTEPCPRRARGVSLGDTASAPSEGVLVVKATPPWRPTNGKGQSREGSLERKVKLPNAEHYPVDR
jgi:hypothetical protein